MDNIIFFISVFLAGILSFFSPCILPLLPVYAGVLLDDKDGAQASSGKFSISLVSLLRTLAFIIGISFVFILLGYGAGFLGDLLYTSWFQYVMGAVIILLGLHQMEVLHLKGLYKERRLQLKGQGQKGNGYSQAFLLGLTFSFAWTPCVGPVLGSVLALAASGGSSLAGCWSHVGLHAGFGATIFGSSSRLQLCFETFPKTASLPRNPQKSGWFPHYPDGNLGAFGKCFHFDYII